MSDVGPCEHCHYEPESDHLFVKVLAIFILLGVLYATWTAVDELEVRVKALERPVSAPKRKTAATVDDDPS